MELGQESGPAAKAKEAETRSKTEESTKLT
jgi:hypothetical protein